MPQEKETNKVSHRQDVVFVDDDAMETTKGRWRWTDKPLDQAWPEYIFWVKRRSSVFSLLFVSVTPDVVCLSVVSVVSDDVAS